MGDLHHMWSKPLLPMMKSVVILKRWRREPGKVALSILTDGCPGDAIPVGLVGGVFTHAGPVPTVGSVMLKSKAPKAEIILSEYPHFRALVMAHRIRWCRRAFREGLLENP